MMRRLSWRTSLALRPHPQGAQPGLGSCDTSRMAIPGEKGATVDAEAVADLSAIKRQPC
jgi:hypothetical protein